MDQFKRLAQKHMMCPFYRCFENRGRNSTDRRDARKGARHRLKQYLRRDTTAAYGD